MRLKLANWMDLKYFFAAKTTSAVGKDWRMVSLGSACASSSSVTHVHRASFFPVLCVRGAHVALQLLDRADHQVIHWRHKLQSIRLDSAKSGYASYSKYFQRNVTSDFPDRLPGVSAHDGKRDYACVIAVLQERGRQEAGCPDMSGMDVSLDHVLAQILL